MVTTFWSTQTLIFAGIEMLGPNSIDVGRSTRFHFDFWSSDAILVGVKLVDFGADNAFGGGDDTEAQIDFTLANDQFRQGEWNRIVVPLSAFETGGLRNRSNMSQIILVGRTDDGTGGVQPGEATVFFDNIFFY